MSQDDTAPTSIDTIWYTSAPVPMPLGLASPLGQFLEDFRGDGIAVSPLCEGHDDGLHRSHYDHSLAHSFRQRGSASAMQARAERRRTRVIGLNWIDEFQAITALLGRRGPEVEHERAAALRGFVRRARDCRPHAGGCRLARHCAQSSAAHTPPRAPRPQQPASAACQCAVRMSRRRGLRQGPAGRAARRRTRRHRPARHSRAS